MATSDAAQHALSDVSVMISYSRDDADFAKRLWSDLKGAGFPTWIDTRAIPGGAEWAKEIRAGIDGAQVVLVVLSPAAMESKWVRKEYAYALWRKKVIIPLDHLPCDIPAALARYQTVAMRPDFVADHDAYYAQQFQMLAVAISKYVTAVPIPVPTRQSHGRVLTAAIILALALSTVLAAAAGYNGGALLPLAIKPYTARLFAGAFALLLLSVLALALRLTRRPDGGVRLYLADRERFLTKLRTRYTNRLKPPFEGALLLTLGLTENTQSVARPALASQEGPAAEPRPLPAGTSITTAFEGAEGQLLILGAPGAGKSWLLYQLAQDLVRRARANGVIPIPVVFNLASWAQDHKSLEDWMADQLFETWQVPQAIALRWVERRQLLPLLDGLDEVRKDARNACVEAINRYQRAHGLEPLAVCCRKVDYDALEARLDLRTAVVAKPLTNEQIDEYLEAGGAPLAPLHTLARQDMQVSDLLSTPLMLNVVALAYEGKPADMIPKPNKDKKAWMQSVFHDYVPTMLARRLHSSKRFATKKRTAAYTEAVTLHYLAWLAVQMRLHGLVDMFYLEQLQPNWLSDVDMLRAWSKQSRWLIVQGTTVIVMLGVDLIVGIHSGLYHGLTYGALGSLFMLGLTRLVSGLPAGSKSAIEYRFAVQWRWPRSRVIALSVVIGLAVMSVLGVGTRFHIRLGSQTLFVNEGPLGRLLASKTPEWSTLLLIALAYLLCWSLLGVTIGGFLVKEVDVHDSHAPDEVARRSLIAGLVMGLVGGLTVGLIVWVMSGPDAAITAGMCIGAWGALDTGVAASIQHWLLLRALARLRFITPHYTAFMDFAADHVLLQRVGGGYRFIHALLLDYFADQWPALSAAEPPKK